MCRCGTEGHSLVADLAVLGQLLNLMILKPFSRLNNSAEIVFSPSKHMHIQWKDAELRKKLNKWAMNTAAMIFKRGD